MPGTSSGFQGATLDELSGISGRFIGYVQVDDGPTQAEDDLRDETMHRRLVPGDGDFDLVGFLRTLDVIGYNAPLGIEVFSDELLALPISDVALRCAGEAGDPPGRSVLTAQVRRLCDLPKIHPSPFDRPAPDAIRATWTAEDPVNRRFDTIRVAPHLDRRGNSPEEVGVSEIVEYGNLIGGQMKGASSGRLLDTVNPANGEVWAKVPLSDRGDADEAVAAAKAAFPDVVGVIARRAKCLPKEGRQSLHRARRRVGAAGVHRQRQPAVHQQDGVRRDEGPLGPEGPRDA